MTEFIRRYDSAPNGKQTTEFAVNENRRRSDIEQALRIRKYDIGGQFSWPIGCNSAQNHTRCLAARWYVDDVTEGGAPPESGPKYVRTMFVHPRC